MTGKASSMESPGPLKDLMDLTKPRLSSLVLVTAGGGLWLSQINVSLVQGLAAVLGTTFVVGGANALNCYLERDSDKLNGSHRGAPFAIRTNGSPKASVFGLILSLISVPTLTLLTTPLAGLLAAIALLIYVLVYTPLNDIRQCPR